MGENKNFKELLAEVEAIVFDVDGVMTDGGIIPLADGDFIRKYNAKDGYALAYAASHGFKIGVISGGFGKTLEQNFELFGNLREFAMLEAPLLVGISRKSMITKTLGINASEALDGTVVLNTMALDRGADILRVHDVKEASHAVALWRAVNNKL